jgi:RNA polymerase sigma-B factor
VTYEPSSEYAGVTEMFRRLGALDKQSNAYRYQREVIVVTCLPLANHIALRYRNRGEPLEDLVQVARVGLLNAVNRFDVENGSDFLAFAVPTMLGEVRRYFRDHGWSMKVPRRLKELNIELERARAELSQLLGRAPTATEVAQHLGIDREAVLEGTLASNAYSTRSTDGSARPDDESQPGRDSFGDVDGNFEKVLDVETVRPLLAALNERERTVLALRFFEHLTQSEIAERIGISQMHVSRLLSKSLATLRSQAQPASV